MGTQPHGIAVSAVLRAGILPALQKLDVIKSSFPGVGTSKPGLLQALTAFITWSDVVTNPKTLINVIYRCLKAVFRGSRRASIFHQNTVVAV